MTAHTHDLGSLVFALRDAASLETLSDRVDAAFGPTGLEEVLSYIQPSERADFLTPLYADRALGSRPGHTSSGGSLVVPDMTDASTEMSALHHLRLASVEDAKRFYDLLSKDPRIRWVGHPSVHVPLAELPTSPQDALPGMDKRWAQKHCGFHDVWHDLDRDTEHPRIGVIDSGSCLTHADIEGRVANVAPILGEPSDAMHAMAVAATICAHRRDDENATTGCTSARVTLYNVWTMAQGFDSLAYYLALKAAADQHLPVLNLSLGSYHRDVVTERAIKDCVNAGVVVVAAMGDDGKDDSSPCFPAGYDDTIAVGSTNTFDERHENANTGRHIWLSAPGQDIWTLKGMERGYWNGTSFAAGLVTAAVWLARTACELSPAEVRELLAHAVDGVSVPEGCHSPELGYGRLDMRRLAALIRKRNCS